MHKDDWRRFERAVVGVAKSPPQSRKAKQKTADELAALIEGQDTTPEGMDRLAKKLGNKD